MKMRKRIAALIAVAMIAALMPMTAFAASDNRLNKGNVHVEKDTVLTTDRGVELVITMKDDDRLEKDSIFAVVLTDGEWDKDTYGDNVPANDITGNFSVRRQSGSRLIITALKTLNFSPVSIPADETADKVIRIPMAAKITGDEPVVEIDPIDSTVSASKFAIAVASEGKAIVTVGKVPTIANTDGMADITFDEPFIKAFKKGDDARTLELELRDSDFSFVDNGAKLVGTGSYYTIEIDTDNSSATAAVIASQGSIVVSGQTVKIVLPETLDKNQRGGFALEGLQIKPNRNAREGDVKVTLSGNLVSKDVVTVAKYGDFTTSLKMAKDDYNVVAGKAIEVKFTLAEEMANALIGNRTVNFAFSKGIVIEDVRVDDAKELAVIPGSSPATRYTKAHVDANTNKIINTIKRIGRGSDINTNEFSVDQFYPNTDKKSSYTFIADLLVPAGYEGDIVLTAEGRGLEEKKEVIVATTEAPVDVEATKTTVKVGLQKQETDAKIVIKETKADRLKKGEDIRVAMGGLDDGLKFVSAVVAVTEGDLELSKDDIEVVGGVLVIPVKRHSTEPATIEITDIVITADRSVPEGSYDVKVGGAAISDFTKNIHFGDRKSSTVGAIGSSAEELAVEVLDEVIVAEDFIVIGTPNTEDINKGKKAVVNFTIGSNKFLVDGKEMEMDAAAYIKDGRTMVPLRYLASALGIEPQSIKFNSGIVTIFDVAKVIQVQVGSKNLVVNSVSIPMVASAEIIDGRTYIPVTEIGSVFGVSGTWDAATQTATFK